MQQNVRFKSGVTLAELLISLAILGVIATFTTIPKILSSSQNSQNVAKAKEVAAMISAAYQKAQLDGIVSASTKPSDLIPYMNYVALIKDSRTIDSVPGFTSRTCDATTPCFSLHGGGTLWFQDITTFSGTSNLHMIEFDFDPDGTYSGTAADNPGKSVQFSLYYNGFLTTRGKLKPNSGGDGLQQPNASFDPSWFTWN